MYKVGVFPGKFFPPHRGHLNSIINAATQCEKLYVVVSDNPDMVIRECAAHKLRPMDLRTRAKWLSIELQGFDHIKVLMLSEEGIPEYPYGWTEWTHKLYQVVPEKFDVLFSGEPEYQDYSYLYPGVSFEVFDYQRDRYHISATLVRDNPMKYWDYILGSARPNFAKRVLITGTESCGKTTLTKYLGKIYHTSWVEEVGRYYSQRYLGGNEDVYTIQDFERIAYEQVLEDEKGLRTCNKVAFFDTDAVVTLYYLEQYLGEHSTEIGKFVDPSKYDVVMMFAPDVKWVPDGQRFLSDDALRWRLHNRLKGMYEVRGFKNIIEISGSYNERLNQAIKVVDELIG